MQRQPLSSSSELSGHLAFTKCHWQASLRPCSLIKVPNQHSTFSNIFSSFFKLLETLRASAAEPRHNQHSVSACDQGSYTGPPWDLYFFLFLLYMSMMRSTAVLIRLKCAELCRSAVDAILQLFKASMLDIAWRLLLPGLPTGRGSHGCAFTVCGQYGVAMAIRFEGQVKGPAATCILAQCMANEC